jgi:hypothetical protein
LKLQVKALENSVNALTSPQWQQGYDSEEEYDPMETELEHYIIDGKSIIIMDKVLTFHRTTYSFKQQWRLSSF